METKRLKRFAQYARRSLLEQVAAKLALVLAEASGARRENEKAVKQLEAAINQLGEEQVIERVAYIWFNRFCALRFMDVNRYSRIGVISPATGQFQPEILAEAKMGHIAEDMVPEPVRVKIFALLDGTATSHDPQTEAYRLLIVAVCNYWHKAMPFLFQRIDDYTELLMPDDLLSGNSILAYTREAMTPDVCKDVEVIGWLYQFYISEKKDEVFAGLKKKKKITPENIPAATQLFTPHWIVRYLVENSLGRLWMLNRPNSRLAADHMEYYIRPKQPETDFLKIDSPEEIKICDPACGSGHMLTFAFDLLYAIYEEEGYEPADIPEKILTHNLFGIEIDERAGELAAFALTMKARARQRRFFRKKVQPNICVLESVSFSEATVGNYVKAFGSEIFSPDIVATLHQFEEANNLGSLIIPQARDLSAILTSLKNLRGRNSATLGSDDELSEEQQVLVRAPNFNKIAKALRQADYLSPKYHVVIANPPYMGSKGMNGRLKSFAQDMYKNSKSDLFAMFMERNLDLAKKQGMVAMITMQSWMFLSSFEKLRSMLLGKNTILSMAHLGARAFDSIGGEVVSTTSFVLVNTHKPNYKGMYIRLVDGKSERKKEKDLLEAANNTNSTCCHSASINDFKKIPDSPIAYWVSEKIRDVFYDEDQIEEYIEARQGLGTGDDAKYFRFFWEISFSKMALGFDAVHDIWQLHQLKWVPLNKGGPFRKWSGNREYVIGFNKQSRDELKKIGNHLPSEDRYLKPFVTWSDITSAINSFRVFEKGYLFSNTGHCAFPGSEIQKWTLLAYCNNRFVDKMTKILNPTIHFHVGYFNLLPNPSRLYSESDKISRLAQTLVKLACVDWDSFETSWDFTDLPLIHPTYLQQTFKATYAKLRTHWQETTLKMQQLEEENNRIFINAYGLQDELDEEVPLNEITLTCNPHYRYNSDKTEDELEALLLADTMREFISYAVGCMFGRYALEKPGLILANQGETLADYLQQIPEPSFPADDDNVIPMLDGDWFTDDITERFRKFLRITFGEEHYEENLKFLEDGLNIKNKRNYTIRDYFLKEFYTDHVKRYKKRPIYWLFSSPKGSFNALIYMHRYRPDTVSVVLNDYLRQFRDKLLSEQASLQRVEASPEASKSEKTNALKQIEKLKKIITELENYERDTLYPLATKKIEIDLDNGVKVNYNKFGKALKKVPGLSVK